MKRTRNNYGKMELTLVEQAQRDILRYISQNKDKTRLPKEKEFTELLGVSRVVVREALSQLRALGLIETKRKSGTTVVAPKVFGVVNTIVSSGLLDKLTLRNLYELRLMLEIGMADFVFRNKTEEQMQEMDAIIANEVECERRMGLATSNEEKYAIAQELTQNDIRFHTKLFEMTGNASLIDFQLILRHLFTLYVPKVKEDFHNRTIVSHVSLYNILRTSTPEAFRVGMRLHLKTQFDDMESILSKVSDIPSDE